MVFSRVFPLGKENSRKVILGFALGEYPARNVSRVASALQSPCVMAYVVVWELAVAIDDCDQSRTIRHCLNSAFDFGRHFPLAAHAIESNGLPPSPPVSGKRFVEFGHDTAQECTVAIPILDEDHERFFRKMQGVLWIELIRFIGVHRHSHAPTMQPRSPCVALNRCDKQFVYTVTLTAVVAKPGCGLENFRIRFAGRIPHVPLIVDLVQNPIQPPMSVWIICCADINLDSHQFYSIDRLARRMARISS